MFPFISGCAGSLSCTGFSPGTASGACPPAAVQGLSPCGGFSCCRALGEWASVVLAPPGSVAPQRVGSFQGSNPGLLHWKSDSLPLGHQGSPRCILDTVARVNKLDLTILYIYIHIHIYIHIYTYTYIYIYWPFGVFLSQGLNQCPLKGNCGVLTTGPPGKSPLIQLFEKVIPQENAFSVCSWCSP